MESSKSSIASFDSSIGNKTLIRPVARPAEAKKPLPIKKRKARHELAIPPPPSKLRRQVASHWLQDEFSSGRSRSVHTLEKSPFYEDVYEESDAFYSRQELGFTPTGPPLQPPILPKDHYRASHIVRAWSAFEHAEDEAEMSGIASFSPPEINRGVSITPSPLPDRHCTSPKSSKTLIKPKSLLSDKSLPAFWEFENSL